MSDPQPPFGPVYRVGDTPVALTSRDAIRLLADVEGIESLIDACEAVDTHRRDRARFWHFVASLIAVVAFFGGLIALFERAA